VPKYFFTLMFTIVILQNYRDDAEGYLLAIAGEEEGRAAE
jgi:hypothetical protein